MFSSLSRLVNLLLFPLVFVNKRREKHSCQFLALVFLLSVPLFLYEVLLLCKKRGKAENQRGEGVSSQSYVPSLLNKKREREKHSCPFLSRSLQTEKDKIKDSESGQGNLACPL